MEILNFVGFPAVNAEVCLSPALGNALVFCSITIIAKGSSIFHEKVSPASPSLTLSWLERFIHMRNVAVVLHTQ